MKSLNKEIVFLLLIFLFTLFMRLLSLDFPIKPYFDEKVYIDSAKTYLSSQSELNPEHPPLGKIIIASGIKIFGDNPIG